MNKPSEKPSVKQEKPAKLTKGMPSAVLLSILIHAALFLLAGLLVVFTVVKVKEPEFEAPKAVERPKMKLRKPKVKLKKTSKPKSTTRIVTRNNVASMPDIQLPEMSGMGEGLGGGLGDGFDMLPAAGEINLIGDAISVGNDFEGTFYDFNRDTGGNPIPMDPETSFALVAKFVQNGWDTSYFSRYYRSPKKLYSTFFCVPTEHSTLGPAAFGEPDNSSWCWIVHYKGKLVYKEDVTFRFWGQGDDYMIVRVDGEEVLIATWPQGPEPWFTSIWQTSSASSRTYPMGGNLSVVGDWITLKAGQAKDMEVIIGEGRGGIFGEILCIEMKGVEYPRSKFMNGPVLPLFRTEEISRDVAEVIHTTLHEGDAMVTNGPVFRDY